MPSLRQHVAAAGALVAATLAAYSPYVTDRLVSGHPDGDGTTYLIVLADACEQARRGVFPVYVGQSALRFNGGLYPQAQAPLLTWLGPLLDLATGRSLPATALLNLIVLLTALGGALVMHVVLLRLAPKTPLTAAALAFAYVACPGVLGVLTRLDMLTTFLTLPLLPWIWHALARAWDGDEARAGVALGAALALLWAAHPPVALWTTTTAGVVGLVGLAVHRRGLKAAALALVVFAAAFAWPLSTLLELTGGRAANVGLGTAGGRLSPDTVAHTLDSLRGDFPAALLPVGWVRGHSFTGWPRATPAVAGVPEAWSAGAVLPYLQLGWMLWAALGAGAWAAFARRDRRLLPLTVGALVVVAFLLPLPVITPRLWALLPGVFNVTKWWPMQRLYPLLASLAAPIGLLAMAALPSRRPRWLAPAALVLLGWSALEAAKFTRLAYAHRARGAEAARLENVRLHAKDLQSAAPRLVPEFTDPWLHLRVLDAAGHVHVDNLDVARGACAAAPLLPPPPGAPELARLTLEPGRRALLCTRAAPRGLLQAFAPGLYRDQPVGVQRDEVLPLFTTLDTPLVVHARLLDERGQAVPLEAAQVRVVSYDPARLPLRVVSWIPLHVELELEGAVGAPLWLETPRQYVPGYRARVDGREVPAERAASGLVAVRVAAGRHTVELDYAAPRALRVAYPVSLTALLLAAVGLAVRRRPAAGIG